MSSIPPEDEALTFARLQHLEQGKMQALGDDLLPFAYPQLAGLRPYGFNLEGKTRKGVPDSFVGESPATCHTAVEYTTQEDRIEKKLEHDYLSVRKDSPTATSIFLCTNRSLEDTDLTKIYAQAQQDNIKLHIIGGFELAQLLCRSRQDLRFQYLAMPINLHTRTSLLAEATSRSREVARSKVSDTVLGRLISRPEVDRWLLSVLHQDKHRINVVTGEAGQGKTVWSVHAALREGQTRPTVWVTARTLEQSSTDILLMAILRGVYGVPDLTRALELADLLRRERLRLFVVLDGVDELRDYDVLEHALRDFRISAIASHTHLLITCREEALPAVSRIIATGGLDPLSFREGNLFMLGPLREEAASLYLRHEGATLEETRHILGTLPKKFCGNPLFLKHALELLRTHKLSNGNVDIVETISDSFITEIQERLRIGGRSRSRTAIEAYLGAMALRTITSADDSIAIDDLNAIPECGDEGVGEGTILRRAVHAGILVDRGEERFGFAHGLFLEHFAARALQRPQDGSWASKLEGFDLQRSGRAIERIATSLKSREPLLRALLTLAPWLACECAKGVTALLSTDLRNELVRIAAGLLQNRFRSERRRGLRLLAGLGGTDSRAAIVAWFEHLSPEEKVRDFDAVGSALLSLEEIGGFDLILQLPQFQRDFPWYEPAFIRELASLSREFQHALVTRALHYLDDPRMSHLHASCIQMLGMLKAEGLIERLRQRLQNGPLDATCHRALIYQNTDDAILVYAESVELTLVAWMNEQNAATDSSSSSAEMRHETVLSGTDVRMYPHNQLLDLVEAALGSPNPFHNAFATEWAKYLKSPRLVRLHSFAITRYPRTFLEVMARGFVESIVRELSFDDAIALYESMSDLANVQERIVAALKDLPGPRTEQFLLERLARNEYVPSAIHALAALHAVQAAPAIHKLFLATPNRWIRHGAVIALGRLRYRLALPDLIAALSAASPPACVCAGKEHDKNYEHALITSIGSLGGEDAVATLGASRERSGCPDVVVSQLIRCRNPRGYITVCDAYESNAVVGEWIINGIAGHDREATIYYPIRLPPPHITDRRLAQAVIETTREALRSGNGDIASPGLNAVAEFDLPEATNFLKQVADGDEIIVLVLGFNMRDYKVQAIEILADQGHASYQERIVDIILKNSWTNKRVGSRDIDLLRRWPSSLVRDRLLAKIHTGEHIRAALFLLQWFAKPMDRQIFAQFESTDDPEIADLAHRYLVTHM